MMDFPVNFVIEIKTQEEFDHLQDAIDILRGNSAPNGFKLSTDLQERIEYRRTNSNMESRVLINGHQIAIGTKEDMRKRFDTECAMHERSNIIQQEWKDGDWKPTMVRRLQSAR